MKKIFVFILYYFLILIYTPYPVYAAPKPLTGTFIFPDFSITDQNTMDTFLDGIKALGMDTLIWGYSGVVYKSDCSSPNYIENNFFTENRSNYLENADKLLTSLHNKGLSVYIGLAGTWKCINVASGNPNDPNTDQGRVIDLSKRLIGKLKELSLAKGWEWDGNFIKGFYIPEELEIHKFYTGPGAWTDYFNFYKNFSSTIKNLYPSKLIMLSPYQYEWYSYQTVYDNMKYAVQNLDIDIYAPQDSVGAGNVVSYTSDQEHFRGLSDAVRDGNIQYNKRVQAWANIETFSPSLDGGASFPPAKFETLNWQLQAVDGFVSKKITWLYSWGFANDPILTNNGPHYTPDYAIKRNQLRNAYIALIPSPSVTITPTPTSTPTPTPTRTPTPTNTPPAPKPGDLNRDGRVDIYDYNILVADFGKTGSPGWIPADITKDGKVDIYDYNQLITFFGK